MREAKAIEPVPEVEVAEVLPFGAPQLQAMILLQMSTGMHPDEVVVMAMAMLDRNDPEAWLYRPPLGYSFQSSGPPVRLRRHDHCDL